MKSNFPIRSGKAFIRWVIAPYLSIHSLSVFVRVICGSIFFVGTISPAPACPMCLGGKTLGISAQELIYARQSVLAEPNPEKTGFKIVTVIKGEADQSDIMEKVLRADPSAPRSSEKPFLLIRGPRKFFSVKVASNFC